MTGYLGNLSCEQQKALDQMRERIKDVATPRCDDRYLLRFLRARQFDVDKSEKKLRATLEFRKRWGADTILEDYQPPQLCIDYFPYGIYAGKDHEGRAVVNLNAGTFDLRGLLKCLPRNELIKNKIYVMERLERVIQGIVKETGNHKLETATVIIDCSGLSTYNLAKNSINLFNEFMTIEEAHYPEIVNVAYIIRQPKLFNVAYALVKNFVDPNTREKLVFCGSNWKTQMQEQIPLETLPELYGGKAKDLGSVKFGGRVPKEFYKQNDETLEKAYIKAGKKFTIEVQVSKVPSELLWEFVTEDHDIGFGVYLQEGNDEVYVVPTERIDAHAGNAEGSYTCEKAGTYVLEWDNSFSWTRGKNLSYRYELSEPEVPEQRN